MQLRIMGIYSLEDMLHIYIQDICPQTSEINLTMSTGITAHDDVAEAFKAFKKEGNPGVYMILKIVGNHVVVDETSEDKDFEAFASKMPADDCRYALYKVEFTSDDGRPCNKLCFIAWAPDVSKIKLKMMYAGTKAALLTVLPGVATKVTATDMSELTRDVVIEAVKKFA
jgi:cofilin